MTIPFKSVVLAGAVLPFVLLAAHPAPAATFSSTKAELLYADYEDRPSGKGFLLTLANATGFSKGDSYFFLDVGDFGDRDETDGIHLEWGPRLSLLRTFGGGQWDGFIKDIYVIGQLDIDANRFSQRVTHMIGPSVDLNVPGFRFFKVHLQYRNDPNFDGDSVQLNLVWNAPFTLGNQKFTFEGFLDWTSSEGASESNLLTQPQLIWHATDHIGVGIEYQYWNNRLGRDELDESVPQAIVRWTF